MWYNGAGIIIIAAVLSSAFVYVLKLRGFVFFTADEGDLFCFSRKLCVRGFSSTEVNKPTGS